MLGRVDDVGDRSPARRLSGRPAASAPRCDAESTPRARPLTTVTPRAARSAPRRSATSRPYGDAARDPDDRQRTTVTALEPSRGPTGRAAGRASQPAGGDSGGRPTPTTWISAALRRLRAPRAPPPAAPGCPRLHPAALATTATSTSSGQSGSARRASVIRRRGPPSHSDSATASTPRALCDDRLIRAADRDDGQPQSGIRSRTPRDADAIRSPGPLGSRRI